jgi:hypothetical protein
MMNPNDDLPEGMEFDSEFWEEYDKESEVPSHLVPVEDKDFLYRDPSSGAIINTNKMALNDYLSAAEKRALQRKKVDSLQSEVSSMKTDISQIKQLLQQLLERPYGN